MADLGLPAASSLKSTRIWAAADHGGVGFSWGGAWAPGGRTAGGSGGESSRSGRRERVRPVVCGLCGG